MLPLIGLWSACTRPDPPGPVEALSGGSFELDAGSFEGVPIPEEPDIFDLVTADGDLDGDPDLFINRHLHERWEWFENQGGAFVQRNIEGQDRSGLYDNPGIPSLFADSSAILAAASEPSASEVHVWHDARPSGTWHVLVDPSSQATLSIESSLPLSNLEGLPQEQILASSPERILFSAVAPLHVTFEGSLTAVSVRVETEPPLTIAAGAERVLFEGSVTLWKNDPHGLAWVDAVGGSEPDLFVCRGALQGQLLPPALPKPDQLFEFVGAETTYVQREDLPLNYARGRQAGWFDIDADGADELYLANTDTPNILLDLEGEAAGFSDRASALGLDLLEDDTFAVLDVDEDGMLDVISAHGREMSVLYQRPSGFQLTPGADVGLEWPDGFTTAEDGIFNPLGLQLVDIDRDGDLDVIAADDEEIRVFERESSAFTDTGPRGLPAPTATSAVIPFDADLDGDLDIAIASGELWIAINDGSGQLSPQRLDASWGLGAPGSAVLAVDVDLDGPEDLVWVSPEGRFVARNVRLSPPSLLKIEPELPRGSTIVAVARDGGLLAMEWGANAVSRYSQSTRPLLIGTPAGREIDELRISLPGGEQRVVKVPEGASQIALR